MKGFLAAAAMLTLLAGGVVSKAMATEGPTATMGKTLFESPLLGSNGKSCSGCHPEGKGLEEIGAYDDAALKEMINFCIRDALAGKMLAPESQDLESMLLYLRSLAGE